MINATRLHTAPTRIHGTHHGRPTPLRIEVLTQKPRRPLQRSRGTADLREQIDMTEVTSACATATKKHPGGRTGTYAGYQAHLKVKEGVCVACRAAFRVEAAKRSQEQRHAEYERNKLYRARANLKRYGVTFDQYDELLARQGGGCAICGGTTPYGRGRFHVDHDHRCCPGQHSCGTCVRGLLCGRCNPGLGAFQDSPDLLVAAAAYLMTSREARTPDAVD